MRVGHSPGADRLASFLVLVALIFGAVSTRAAAAPEAHPRYDILVEYRHDAPSLRVSGTMTVPRAALDMGELEVSLAEFAIDPVFRLADQAIPGARRVPRPMEGRKGWGTNTWRMAVPEGKSGADQELTFSYAVRGETFASIFHVGPTLAFAGGIMTAWYPQLERVPVGPDGRLRGVRGVGRVSFDVPPGFEIVATGRRLDGAARTPTWEIENPLFFAFSVARYEKVEQAGPVPALLYQLAAREDGGLVLRRSQEIIDLLSREFSPYPHPSFAVVEVPTDIAQRAGFSGASMEGFIFSTADFLARDFNTALHGHEIGHQWWPYLIGPEGQDGLYLLTDALAQHASLVAVEALEGSAAAERYRRTGFPGYFAEYSGRGYLLLAAAGLDKPLSLTGSSRIDRTLAETKGMLAWRMLSREMGPERLRSTFGRVFAKHSYRRMSFGEFRRVFQEEAGTDLGWFFEQWFDRSGVPELALAWSRTGRGLDIGVTQRGAPYRLKVPVQVRLADGTVVEHVLNVAGASSVHRVPCRGEVVDVTLDPRFEILRWTQDSREEAEALAPHTRAINAYWAGEVDQAIALYRSALASRNASKRHALAFLLHAGLAEALFAKGEASEALEQARLALAMPDRSPEIEPWVHLLVARIAKGRGDLSTMRDAIEMTREAEDRAGGNLGASYEAAALAIDRKDGT